MGKVRRDVYVPDEARADAYDALYAHYRACTTTSAAAATTSCTRCARLAHGGAVRD